MKAKLSRKFWAALTIFSLMGQIAWVVENMYFNVFVYKMFNAGAGDISDMVAASADMITNNDGTTSFVPNANIFLAALVAAVMLFPLFVVIKKIKKV